MSTVDEWARREAEKRFPASRFSSTESHRETQMHQGVYREALTRMAALLLSDEALRAMQSQLISGEQTFIPLNELHHAVEAALTKITEEGQ